MPIFKLKYFNSRYTVDKITGCWNWNRPTDRGYGIMVISGLKYFAHRISAHLHLGFDIDSHLCICHTCDNPSCVNPEHLFIGTQADNIRDRSNKGKNKNHNSYKTVCKHGHIFSKENTIISSRGLRICRECNKRRSKETHRRKMERRNAT